MSDSNGHAIVTVEASPSITIGCFKVTTTGLVVTGKPTYDEWYAFGETLQFLEKSIQFALGDWLNYGEKRWSEKYTQALEETDYEYGTLRNYAYVAEHVKLSLRSDKLSFTHHKEIAPLDPERQKYYLDLAMREGLSVSRLRQVIKEAERQRVLAAQTPPVITPDANILLGDCTQVTWPRDIDLIIADPPFGLSTGQTAGVREGKGAWDVKDYCTLHDFNRRWLTLAVDALKDEGSLLVFGTVHNVFSIGHILKELGLYIVRDIVWRKPFVQKQVNMNALIPEHELIIWARKGKRHTCNLTELTRDVWDVQPAAKFHHPTEKPETLITRLIDMASHPGELVADPFLGSGTTAACAKQLKRTYWGVEQDDYWWGICCDRLR